jgi:hypothetical protein
VDTGYRVGYFRRSCVRAGLGLIVCHRLGGEAAALRLLSHVRKRSTPFEWRKVNMPSVEDELPHFVLEAYMGHFRVEVDIMVGVHRRGDGDSRPCTLGGMRTFTVNKGVDDPSGLDVCFICVAR